MAGGPINGGDLFNKTGNQYKNLVSTILIPTVLQTANDVVSQFAGLTCLYNKNWYNRRDKLTLPLCFFYIKSVSEDRDMDVSEQRVILYDPQLANQDTILAGDLANPLRPGVQEVIADNLVIKPKTYSLEVILPFQIGTGLMARQMTDLNNMFDGFSQILLGSGVSLSQFFAPVQGLLSLGNQVLESAAKLPDSAGAAYINKNSLEAMQEAQTTVTLKMWTGYDYKYVVITSLSIKKDGKEDNAFRATMKLKEVPILTVNAATDVTAPGGFNRNWAATAISFQNRALLDPLIALTGVGQASL